MHLRPAKYTKIEAPIEGAEALGRIAAGSSERSSGPWSTMSLGGVILGDGKNNNNRQFTAIKANHKTTTTEAVAEIPPESKRSTPQPSINAINAQQNNKDSRCEAANYFVDGSSGKSISALTQSLPINYNNTNHTKQNNNTNNNRAKNLSGSKYDKMKLMELSIINLVELSSLAMEEKRRELALERAKEALDGLSSLKGQLMLEQRAAHGKGIAGGRRGSTSGDGNGSGNSGNGSNASSASSASQNSQTVLMTKGVRLFQLSIMVNSNLAGQLRNNGHLDESLEIYTQLCKLAAGSSTAANLSSMSAFQSMAATSSGTNKYDAKVLLYRFGLNIGNVLYEMKEYQRALKYYRLTLDRLSSSANQNLKMKLMNNIAVTFMAMSEASNNDAITSLNLLLADNLSQQQQQQQQQAQSQAHQQSLLINNEIINDGAGSGASSNQQLLDVCNSNHHRFGLNLIICLYQNSDLPSMMNVLESLVRVGICHQYERVFDLDASERKRPESSLDSDEVEGIELSSAATGITAHHGIGSSSSHAQEQHNRPQLALARDEKQQQLNDESSTVNRALALDGLNSGDNINGSRALPLEAPFQLGQRAVASKEKEKGESQGARLHASKSGSTLTESYIDYQDDAVPRLLTASVQGKAHFVRHLEPSRQWSGANSFAGKLTKLSVGPEKYRQVMSVIQDDRLEMLISGKHKQIFRSLIMACKLLLHLVTTPAASDRGRKSIGYDETSVFDQCLKLLSTSYAYKGLVHDLKTNSMSAKLDERTLNLDEALAMLKGLEMDHGQAVEDGPRESNAASLRMFCAKRLPGHTRQASGLILKSPMAANNSCFLYLVQHQTKKAIEYAELALKVDKLNVQAWLNLGNCHYELKNFETSETCYQRALSIEPSNWIANYNLALVERQLGRQMSKVKLFYLTGGKGNSSLSLANRKNFLAEIQLALAFQHYGQHQRSSTIINDLMRSSHRAPEIFLLACRSFEDSTKDSSSINKSMSILQQANAEHPYYIPISERLIAYNIQTFNYVGAQTLLMTCIKNRPDQIKWYQMLAECHRRAADYNRAIAIYKLAVETFPHDTSCLRSLLKLADELGLTEDKKIYEAKLARAQAQVGVPID